MFIYILFLGFIFLLGSTKYIIISNTYKNHIDKTLFFISSFCVFVFSAIRFNVGWDYKAYYYTIKNGLVTNIIDRGEIINIALIDLSRKLHFPFLYFILTSLIIVFSIYVLINKYSVNKWMSLILFVTFPLFYLNSMSVIRFFVALSISIFGLRYIEKKSFIKYLAVIFIATLFHKTALFCIVFYFVDKINFNRLQYILFLCCSPLFGLLFKFTTLKFFPVYQNYFNKANNQEGTKAIIIIVFVGIISTLCLKYIKENKAATMYFKFYFIGMCIYLLFASYGTLGHRLSLYGTIYLILLIPYLIKSVCIYPKWICNLLVYLVFCLSFIYTLYVGAEAYLPYSIFLDFL